VWYLILKARNGAVSTGRIGGRDRSEAIRNARWAFPGKTVMSCVRIS
jgi:hypothetical protein